MTRLHGKLQARDGISGCTLCGSSYELHSSHVIPRAGSGVSLPLYYSKLLIDFTDHDVIENKILLCRACHKPFDSNSQQASWILVPCDLRYFLRYEQKSGWRDGSVPSYEDYQQRGGSRYQFYPFVSMEDHPSLRRGAKTNGGEVVWHGEPVAMILKAFAGMTRIPEPGVGLPPNVRDMLFELQKLYTARPTTWPRKLSLAEEATGLTVHRNIIPRLTATEERHYLQWRDGCTGCTLCGSLDALRSAHVLPAAGSKTLLPLFNEKRLINFTEHRDTENKILLCKKCHSHFRSNSQQPLWILVPCDLQYFLRYEQKRSWIQGDVPSDEDYQARAGSRYKFYSFVSTEGHPTLHRGAMQNGGEVVWRGEPVAMILKAFTGMSRIPEEGAGLPPGVLDTLNELLWLYRSRPKTWPRKSILIEKTANVVVKREVKPVCSLRTLSRSPTLDTPWTLIPECLRRLISPLTHSPRSDCLIGCLGM